MTRSSLFRSDGHPQRLEPGTVRVASTVNEYLQRADCRGRVFTFPICPVHGYLAGEHMVLPEVRRGASGTARLSGRDHGLRHVPLVTPHNPEKENPMRHSVETLPTEQRQRCEVWTRMMGYHRPVSQFNHGTAVAGEYSGAL